MAKLLPAFLCFALAALATPAVAALPLAPPEEDSDPAITRPAAAQRLVASFDFDQPEPYDIPRHWDLYRPQSSQQPRFPAWNTATLDFQTAHRGIGSVRLSTSGGSVRLRLDPGVIPVFPENEYLISARVLTRNLQHARAAIAVRYLDSASRPIAESEARSELILAEDDQWRPVAVPLSGDVPGAGYLQIDLEILQPREYSDQRLGRHQVWPQDFDGHAWFDDVAVVQLPRVRMSTSSPTNIIEAPERPQISVDVRDLAGEALAARLLVQNAAGHIVDRRSIELRGGSQSFDWKPQLTSFGWYRAVLELEAAGRGVGATHVDFAWVPPPRIPARDAVAFGIVLDRLPTDQMHHLPELVRHTGAGSVTIPVWSRRLTLDSLSDFSHDLAGVLHSLQTAAVRIAFSLHTLPAELARAAAVDPDDPAAIFLEDESRWTPYLMPLLDRFGQSVQRWQLGATPEPADARRPISRLRATLEQLVPGPIVTLPWHGELDPGPASTADELLVTLPAALPPRAVADFAAHWAQDGPVSFLLEPADTDRFSREDAAAALVRSATMLWAARTQSESGFLSASTLTCTQPWSWKPDARGTMMPRVELPAWRNLVHRLSGRRVVGRFPAGDGIVALILAPADGTSGGAIVAWQDGPADPAIIEACLGTTSIRAVDIFGNAASIDPSDDGLHRVTLSHHPIFLEDVDIALVRFLASVMLDPQTLEPSAPQHTVNILLSNPWPSHLQGRITVLEPGGLLHDPLNPDRSWRIAPRVQEFALPSGQNARLPLRIAFSAVEEHGPKEFVAEVEFFGREYPRILVRSQLEIRLDDIELELSYSIVPVESRLDLIVEATLINRSELQATLELTAFAAEYPRSRASVSHLIPGGSATRRFSFPDGGRALRFGSIAVTAHNTGTGARITRTLPIE